MRILALVFAGILIAAMPVEAKKTKAHFEGTADVEDGKFTNVKIKKKKVEGDAGSESANDQHVQEAAKAATDTAKSADGDETPTLFFKELLSAF